MQRKMITLALATSAALTAASAHAAYTVANFEDGTTDGFGNLSSGSGVQPFAAPVTGSVVTPTSGSNLTKVLDLAATGYNGGQNGGAGLGYDFHTKSADQAAFLANDILSFNWEVPPNSDTGGYAQLYQIVMNAPGAGYTVIGGTSSSEGTDAMDNQYPGYTGQTNTFTFNYDAFKALISANPSYIQLGIVTNNGGGTPTTLTDFYFDNFTLSAVPEPASVGVASVFAVGALKRRRRA